MMNKSKTSKAWRWKVATFLPLLALLLMAFGNRSETTLEMSTLSERFGVHSSELANDVKSLTSEIVPSSSEKISIQDNKKRKTEPSVSKKDQPIQVEEKTVKGKVVDSEDKPLEGASVVVSGKTIGTVTDKDGVFNLNLNDTNSIVISYVGFKSAKVIPDFEKSLTIKMVPENVDIEKVVVVAYGTRKKSSSTTESNNEGNANSGKNEIFTIVEEMPEFPGGLLALRKHIAQQIKYPVSAQEAGIQGNVFVSFVINKYGVVSNVKVTKSLHPALDNEAVRVVYSMPKWKPGIQQGKAVDVAYTMPIEFVLQYGSPEQLSSQIPTNPGETSMFSIEVRKDGNYIDNKMCTLEEIGKKGKLSTEKNPNGVVGLKVESDVPMSRVTEVKEMLRKSKVLNINYQSVMKSDVSSPSALPPPPPPTVKDLGFRITISNDAFRVNSKELTFEDIEKMINEINPQKQFIQIDSHSTSSKELQSSLKEMLEKKNITYQILWSK